MSFYLYQYIGPYFAPVVSPFIKAFGPALGTLVIAAIVIFFIDVVYEIIMDKELMEELQESGKRIKELQKKLSAAKAVSPEKAKEIEEEILKEHKKIMSKQAKVMKTQLLGMAITFPPIIILVYGVEYKLSHWTIKLPFSIPYVGDTLGPVGWYFLCAITVSVTIKPLAELLVAALEKRG